MSPDLQVSVEALASIDLLVAAQAKLNRMRKQHPADLQQVLMLVAELHRLGTSVE